MKKQVLVRGVDDAVYRRAKAAAASLGLPMGAAVEEALRLWSGRVETTAAEKELAADQQFVKDHWGELRRHEGKVAVVAEGGLKGLFENHGDARRFSSRFRVAMTFAIEGVPGRRELDLGPEMAVQ